MLFLSDECLVIHIFLLSLFRLLTFFHPWQQPPLLFLVNSSVLKWPYIYFFGTNRESPRELPE